LALDLTAKYKNVKLTPIRKYDWARDFFCMIPLEFFGTLENSLSKHKSINRYTNYGDENNDL